MGNHPLVDPLYQTAKFRFERFSDIESTLSGQLQGFFYSRISNPTVRSLEMLLAKLQGRDDGIALASGVAALNTLFLSVLSPGDEVIVFVQSYKPTRTFVRGLLARFGIKYRVLSLTDPASLESELKSRPARLVLFESPSNPMLRIANIERLVSDAKAAGAITALDNTFAGFHNHGQFEIDVFIHSLSKFAGGHGDAIGGAIIANKPLIDTIRATHFDLGACMDPHSAYLFLRGMKTYTLRFRQQCENARKVAAWLEKNPSVERVLYPGLPSHPEHGLAKKQMKDFGSVIAFDVKGDRSQMIRFLEELKLISVTASLGSTDSLIAPSHLFYAGDLTEDERQTSGISPTTVRLAIGIEHPDDLIADLEQALQNHSV